LKPAWREYSPLLSKAGEHMSNAFGAKFDKVCEILDRYEKRPTNLIPILQEIQEEYSYLPEDVMTYVATAIGTSPGSVFGVATFYSHFTLTPKGKHVIRVCDGTACHVRKSAEIIKTLEAELNLNAEKKTSSDLMFTLETVACLGACGLAPVVVADDEVHGAMTKEKTIELIKSIREGEVAHA
jgi:NADH-quinone oxidoreductase subunit E